MADLSEYWENGCPVRGFYLMLGAGDTGSAAATAFHSFVFLWVLVACLLRSLPGGKAPPWAAWWIILAATVVIVVIGKIWRRRQEG
jgi:hypothetical protein